MTIPDFDPRVFETPDLRMELATRRLSGPLVAGHHPQRWFGWAVRIPAFVLIGVLLVAPVGWTVWLAVDARPVVAGGCGLAVLCGIADTVGGRTRRWLSMLGLLIVSAVVVAEFGAAGTWAYVRTLVWVLWGVFLVLLALLLAWVSRGPRWVWLPLVLPFGISAFASGIAFRLIFESIAGTGWVDSVGAYRWWFVVMLGSAFTWTWLGALTGVWRAAILGVEADPVQARTVHGTGGPRARGFARPLARGAVHQIRMLHQVRKLLHPTLLMLGLIVGVAAARVFDVVLIAVPGPLQSSTESATVHRWYLAGTAGFGDGYAAAYALPLAVLIGLTAWLLQPDMRRYRRPGPETRTRERDSVRPRASWLSRVLLVILLVPVLAPIDWLIWVALRQPRGFGAEGLRWVWNDAALWRSLETTLWVSTLATIVVVTAAVPIAFWLAELAPGQWISRIAVPLTVVLTVMPAQIYGGPIRTLMDLWGLSGSRIPLIFVHAAGLPMAILILRGALLAPPESPAADALHGLARAATIWRRFLEMAGPAIGAVAVLEFIQVWNDFFIGLLIGGIGETPWSRLLWGEARQFHENANHLAAGALLSAILPVVILLCTWRRWVVPGITGGVRP
ncbi:carbohydrate ABC transporter permease [Nocardia crassostreae]|uniref:carbohydrate ABC transporter permease n=1 Tax=Nocardia crassostreae TaxID=53428 RepID=UPI0008296BA7|nr:carbohydrate ABC transporter permease [Nocardia crassostreae]